MNVKARILFPLICMFLLVSGSLMGQKSSTIVEKEIVSRTVYEYFIEEGMDEPVVESIETFNERGDLTELKEFNSKGEVKRWEKYSYDNDGMLVEEVFLDAKGKVEQTEKSLYVDGLRVEKQYFNNKDKLYKRKVYEYEFRN
jgi:hypothetical protein